MAKIFITGSTDGLGLLAAKELLKQGHEVFLHARNQERKEEVMKNNPAFKKVFVADFADVQQIIALANEVNQVGKFDVIIHNAGVYTASGEAIFTVNVLAPYILSCLLEKPQRLIYVSSDMHLGGHSKIDNIKNNLNSITYSDSKLQVLMLCKAFARAWPNVYTNALHPGWVPTKMGGKGAPDDLQKGFETQVWLAVSNDNEALVNGKYFFHKKQSRYHIDADNIILQNKLIALCEEITGVGFNN
jgi:NAD(P)-dependent dehydrogenase (short-subunit alcohol dehydrogenase family)